MENSKGKYRKTPEGKTTLTVEQDEFLKKNYLEIPIKSIARLFNKSGDLSVRTRLRQLGLKIPPELAEERKRAGMIRKGYIPPNKGKKQTEFMTAEQIEKTKHTRFKKGNIPHNTSEKDGDIRIRVDHKERNGGRKCQWIRISLGVWKELHIYNWESVNGFVPEGFIIRFKDNDSLNANIDNLELISKAENMRRNTMHRYPEDIKEIIHIKARITRQINKHSKKKP